MCENELQSGSVGELTLPNAMSLTARMDEELPGSSDGRESVEIPSGRGSMSATKTRVQKSTDHNTSTT